MTSTLRLFLCGDVMIGRGIDQVLPRPCLPRLYEQYVSSAEQYVALAERAHGSIRKPVSLDYVWGAALEELDRIQPDARIINLETAITRCEAHALKGINYRVSPENAACLATAGIDCAVVANNHVLDWGDIGLVDTLTTLQRLGIKSAGAGRTRSEAIIPAILDAGSKARALVFAYGTADSGIPRHWAAREESAGVILLETLSEANVDKVVEQISQWKRPGDVVIVSLHWGPNWGYDVTGQQRAFAHRLIDCAGVSIIHGHSAHHPLGIEVYRDRLILYGCGDFLNDYEGIGGYEMYRGDLSLMYFATVDPPTGTLERLTMTPLQIRRLSLRHASAEDAAWLCERMDRESRKFGSRVHPSREGFALGWPRS
jgi:poly-gamma-glutamate synthesis protein (capsule biosynthesis protein)